MKRFLALLCLTAMLCTVFTACGDDDESTAGSYDDDNSYSSYDDDYQEAVDGWREASEEMDSLIADYKKSQG